jgi:hypothetical protein
MGLYSRVDNMGDGGDNMGDDDDDEKRGGGGGSGGASGGSGSGGEDGEGCGPCWHSSRPCFEHESGDVWLYHIDERKQWFVAPSLGSLDAGLYVTDSAAHPLNICSVWKAWDGSPECNAWICDNVQVHVPRRGDGSWRGGVLEEGADSADSAGRGGQYAASAGAVRGASGVEAALGDGFVEDQQEVKRCRKRRQRWMKEQLGVESDEEGEGGHTLGAGEDEEAQRTGGKEEDGEEEDEEDEVERLLMDVGALVARSVASSEYCISKGPAHARMGKYSAHARMGKYSAHARMGKYSAHARMGKYSAHARMGKYSAHARMGKYSAHARMGKYSAHARMGKYSAHARMGKYSAHARVGKYSAHARMGKYSAHARMGNK